MLAFGNLWGESRGRCGDVPGVEVEDELRVGLLVSANGIFVDVFCKALSQFIVDF